MAKKSTKKTEETKPEMTYDEFINAIQDKSNLKDQLTFKEMIAFVADVVNNCFDDENKYYPQLKDYHIFKNVITYFTNIELPTNVETIYDWYVSGGIPNDLLDKRQFQSMLKSIDEAIDFKKQQIIHYSPMNDLINDIRGIVGGMKESFDFNTIKDILPKLANMNPENVVKEFINMKSGGAETDTNEFDNVK